MKTCARLEAKHRDRGAILLTAIVVAAFLVTIPLGRTSLKAKGGSTVKVTLTWEGPVRLDLQATGPIPGTQKRFHVFRSQTSLPGFVSLRRNPTGRKDVITVGGSTPGVYQYYVHDYTKRAESCSDALSRTGARVELYVNNHPARVFEVSRGKEGNLWTVFSMDGDRVTPVNNMSDEEAPLNVGSTPESALIPGDILMGRMADSLVPGKWSHVGIYAGDGNVVEACNADEPVSVRALAAWENPNMMWVTYMRVVPADSATRTRAIRFAREQVGKPYDIGFHTKQLHGDSWYCSELVWAAYMNASGGKINLEKSPDPIGVYPWEIEDSEATEVIGGHYEKRQARTLRIVYLGVRTFWLYGPPWVRGTLIAIPAGLILAICLVIRRRRRKRDSMPDDEPGERAPATDLTPAHC